MHSFLIISGAWLSNGKFQVIGHVQSLGKRSRYRWMCVASSVKNFSSGFLESNTGKDLLHMIASKIPQKPGSRILLQHESQKLLLNKSLQEQGFHGEVTLHYVYTQLDLLGAWKYLLGFRDKSVDEEESVLEGITQRLENVTSEPRESRFARQLAKLDISLWV